MHPGSGLPVPITCPNGFPFYTRKLGPISSSAPFIHIKQVVCPYHCTDISTTLVISKSSSPVSRCLPSLSSLSPPRYLALSPWPAPRSWMPFGTLGAFISWLIMRRVTETCKILLHISSLHNGYANSSTTASSTSTATGTSTCKSSLPSTSQLLTQKATPKSPPSPSATTTPPSSPAPNPPK